MSILICVDSQSVLQSLKNNTPKERSEIIFEIKSIINVLINNGIFVNFCWVPSHCGIKHNESADHAAKQGANNVNSQTIDIAYSLQEKYHIIDKFVVTNKSKSNMLTLAKGFKRRISSLAIRLHLNAWTTKFCKDIYCTCKEAITIDHILFHCKDLESIHKLVNVKSIEEMNFQTWLTISQTILDLPIAQYL